MKCRPAALLALLTLLASGDLAGSDPPEDAPTDVEAESLRLIQGDVRRLAASPAAAAAPADPSIIKLSPFIVNGKKLPPVVIPKYESQALRLLRTGRGNIRLGPLTLPLVAGFEPAANPTGSPRKGGPRAFIGISLGF